METSPIPQPQAGAAPPEPSSLADRLTNVIAAPGEVFEEIRNVPARASNWIVPMILSCIVTIIYFWVAFSQPPVLRSVQEQRIKAMQKSVAEGKITQAQADQASAMYERIFTPTLVKIIGAGGAILAELAGLFLFGLALWIGLKCCTDGTCGYMKIVEVCGLSWMIDVPQKIVRLLLVAWKQNLLATASPTLFLDNPSTTNRTHVFLSIVDVIDIWWLAVLSLGLSKVASISYRTAALITFGIWFGFRIIMAFLTPAS